jgi:hypothetical protein
MDLLSPHPYDFVRDEEGRYNFVNKHGVHYRLYFLPLSIIYPEFINTYSFTIEAVDDTPHPMDRRIAATVVEVLRIFFQDNENAMIMTCDSVDGKQRKRRQLFDRWFDIYNENSILSRVDVRRGNSDYELLVSLYYKESNPNKEQLLKAFRELMTKDLYEIVI